MTEGTGMTLAGPIVERLRCPSCHSTMVALEDGGGVGCQSGHTYRMRSGYLDCSGTKPIGGTTDRTFASFGYEWNTFDEVRDEDQEFAEVYFRDLDLAGLAGQVGLGRGMWKGSLQPLLRRAPGLPGGARRLLGGRSGGAEPWFLSDGAGGQVRSA